MKGGKVFRLILTKSVTVDAGDRFVIKPWVPSGDYPIVRIFDEDRVMVDISKSGKNGPTLTLLRITDGEIIDGDEADE